MKLERSYSPKQAPHAFTLVEVAIALAVIGFALVAIIGILPAGLNVQKENREETIINQEASIWMDAIRSGAKGMDYLTNYVDGIEITYTNYDVDGTIIGGDVYHYTPTGLSGNAPGYPLDYGSNIVGLLTTPKYELLPGGGFVSNNVVAYVRAFSGAATDLVPQDNSITLEGAFAYRLTCEMVPFFARDDRMFNFSDYNYYINGGATNNEPGLPLTKNIGYNVHELRLRFDWPLRPPYNFNGTSPVFPERVGKSSLSFRTMVGGRIDRPGIGLPYVFIQRGQFERPEEP